MITSVDNRDHFSIIIMKNRFPIGSGTCFLFIYSHHQELNLSCEGKREKGGGIVLKYVGDS